MQKEKKQTYTVELIESALKRWLRGEKLSSISADLKISPTYISKLVHSSGTAYRWTEVNPVLMIMVLEKAESKLLSQLEDVRERLATLHRVNVTLFPRRERRDVHHMR